MINREIIHLFIQRFLLILFVITIPFSVNANSFCLILLILNFIFEKKFKEKWKILKGNKFALLFIGLYIIQSMGILYSENIPESLSKLEKLTSILIFPIIFVSNPSNSKQFFVKLLHVFLISCIAACLICMAYAIYRYSLTQDTQYFFYHEYGSILNIHAIYFSMYLLLSLFISIFLLNECQKRRLIYWILIIFLLINVILLSSKIVIGTFFILINLFILNTLLKHFKVWKRTLFVVFLNLSILFVLYNIPYVKGRFMDLYKSNLEVVTQNNYQYDTYFSGLTIRLVFWKSVFKILNNEDAWIFGVGVGDSQDLLNEQYKKMNLYTGNVNIGDRGYLDYNPHNQYFDILLKLGLIGLVYFLLIILLPMRSALSNNGHLYLVFLIIISATCLTESIFGLQKGVVFYSFFNSLFAFTSSPKQR